MFDVFFIFISCYKYLYLRKMLGKNFMKRDRIKLFLVLICKFVLRVFRFYIFNKFVLFFNILEEYYVK